VRFFCASTSDPGTDLGEGVHAAIHEQHGFFGGSIDVTYTPDDSTATSDSFTYYVQDRGANSATPATVNITINRN
jgi:hypothetical protein